MGTTEDTEPSALPNLQTVNDWLETAMAVVPISGQRTYEVGELESMLEAVNLMLAVTSKAIAFINRELSARRQNTKRNDSLSAEHQPSESRGN